MTLNIKTDRDMKKYKPIRIFSIKFGYGYWWGKYCYFIGKKATAFAIMPIWFHLGYCTYVSNNNAIENGMCSSWDEERQRENAAPHHN